MAAPAVDGHESLIGVFGGDPRMVPRFYAHQSVNSFFRGDKNRRRPSIQSIELQFETDADRVWFQGGNVQGAFFYSGFPSTFTPRLIVQIAGKVFSIIIRGRKGIVSTIWDGNARQMTLAWFAQGFEWLFIQDGINPPVFWNGTDPARRSDPFKNEMPVGSVMAYIHGRMAVASADGQNTISVGDIVYGSNVTNHNDLLLFTEQQYWAEGGSFDIAANLGDIMGLYPMPFIDTGDAQNELVALCAAGFTSFDLSTPREEWIDRQVQKISMIGQGCVSSYGFAGLNGDVFYRRADGIGSYRNARVEYSQGWKNTPVSREVEKWISKDRNDLLKFIPMVSWQNMVLCGCSPMLEAPNNSCAGYHRYCRGFVVFDAQSMSTASRDGTPVWHGMWTGIRPTAFVQGRIDSADRCFAFSFDRDGKNRLYELTLTDGDDLFGSETRRIFSFYDTGAMGQVEARTSLFDVKRLLGGQLVLSNILRASDFDVQLKSDGAPCWISVGRGEPGCDCPTYTGCGTGTRPQWANHHLPSIPDNVCVPGTNQPAKFFHYSQLRVVMNGSMQVERMKIKMEPLPDAEVATCLGNNCTPITCCPDADDYTYHIAPVGTNNEIPDVPCPSSGDVRYVSTRFFTARCPDFPLIYAMGMGQATSTISQEDADAKALVNAQTNATAALNCPSCSPQVLTNFIADGDTENLSPFFAAGANMPSVNEPWRLFDVVVQQYIARGIVNPSGTLQTDSVYSQYTHGSFDPVTSTYTDNGGSGPTTISLQIGCNGATGELWPDDPHYGIQ